MSARLKGTLVSFRVSGELKDKIDKLRKEEFINISELARHLVEQFINEKEGK